MLYCCASLSPISLELAHLACLSFSELVVIVQYIVQVFAGQQAAFDQFVRQWILAAAISHIFALSGKALLQVEQLRQAANVLTYEIDVLGCVYPLERERRLIRCLVQAAVSGDELSSNGELRQLVLGAAAPKPLLAIPSHPVFCTLFRAIAVQIDDR
jgi:hypothetical protein